jgi:hypothetical protein
MTAARPVEQSLFPDIAPDRPRGPIPASVVTGTNADLIAKVAPLYLTGSVLDVTYGEGNWWTRYKPEPFTYHDKYKVDGIDFRQLPETDSSVDTVCFDPPYVAAGGESTGNLGSGFQDAYGIGHSKLAAMSESTNRVGRIEDLILAGLAECLRVARIWVLVKCMEFAQGRAASSAYAKANMSMFHDVPHIVTVAALEAGWVKHDQIVHHTGSGPGGHNIFVPKRARRHHSYLLVFAKGPL